MADPEKMALYGVSYPSLLDAFAVALDGDKVFSILRGNGLIARYVDSGAMVYLLAAGPPEDGHGGEHLPAWGVGGQAAALSAGMEEDALFAANPSGEIFGRCLGLSAGFE